MDRKRAKLGAPGPSTRRSDVSERTTNNAERDQVLRSIDIGSWYAGVRDFYFSLLVLSGSQSPVGSDCIARYSGCHDGLLKRLPHRTDGLKDVKGVGLLRWTDCAAVLCEAAGQAAHEDERVVASRAIEWLRTKGIGAEWQAWGRCGPGRFVKGACGMSGLKYQIRRTLSEAEFMMRIEESTMDLAHKEVRERVLAAKCPVHGESPTDFLYLQLNRNIEYEFTACCERLREAVGGALPWADMSDSKPTVVIPLKCAHCEQGIDVQCEHVPGFSITHFYTVDCPHCGKRNHRQLPGDIVDVRPRSQASGETA